MAHLGRGRGAEAGKHIVTTIYTFGTQRRRLAELVALVHDLDALVVDVRLAPRSRVREWNQAVMAAALGDRYLHVGALGNLNYKTAGTPVRLCDMEAGIAALEPARAAGQSAILVCYEGPGALPPAGRGRPATRALGLAGGAFAAGQVIAGADEFTLDEILEARRYKDAAGLWHISDVDAARMLRAFRRGRG
ncbi:MAG: DUF488 family protein [Anaerolineae bacterium]|nr:DUF488 family protein [Anaerolineae bacterium]